MGMNDPGFAPSTVEKCEQLIPSNNKEDGVTHLTVNYDDARKYRLDIGIGLYSESIKLHPDPKHIVEIGPGAGEAAHCFFESCKIDTGRLTFIEPNIESYRTLSQKFQDAKILSRSLEEVLYSEQFGRPFDLVVANFSLHWVEHLESVASKIWASMSPNGVLAFSNTDSTRSFWNSIDVAVKEKFPGNSLFNIENSHSLSASNWVDIFAASGFILKSRTDYSGTAAVFDSPEIAFAEFKSMVGDRYLKLNGTHSKEEIETFVKSELKNQTNPQGNVRFWASGFRLVFQKPDSRLLKFQI